MSCARFLGCVLSVVVLLSACSGSPSATSDNPRVFSWRQAQGITLKVLVRETKWLSILNRKASEFEGLTGIRLAVEIYPQVRLWEVLETALAEPGRVDVFMLVPAMDSPRFHRAGRMLPLNDLMRDSGLTDPEFSWGDILPRFRAAGEIDGALLSIPVMGEYLGILYRRDIFNRYQVKVPETLSEFEAAARFLHMKPMGPRNEPGVGVVSRGNGAIATNVYAAILHAMGGTWFDGARRPTINGPQGLAALEFIQRMTAYAPPDLARYGWQEASDLFTAGRAAMYIEGSSVFPILEKPSSHVAGKVGYSLFPSGPGGPGTSIAAISFAIARRSANPHAAWLFLQWASGRKMSRDALGIEDILVPRESAWNDRTARQDIPGDLREAFLAAGRTGNTQYIPPMVAITSAREAIGEAIDAAIRGEDIRAAADRAAARLTEILRTTEP